MGSHERRRTPLPPSGAAADDEAAAPPALVRPWPNDRAEGQIIRLTLANRGAARKTASAPLPPVLLRTA